MSKHVKHDPKHRAAPSRPAVVETPRKVVRTALLFSSVAVAATGVAVAGGLLASGPDASADSASSALEAGRSPVAARPLTAKQARLHASTPRERQPTLSRSADRRDAADPLKTAALSEADGPAVSGSRDLADSDPREIGMALLGEFGFGSDQFGCLDSLYNRESGWNIYADNPSSSAYGIPQALPGSKMASAGPDWATNPVTQIRWGLGYIQDRYGSPCGAWSHSLSNGWY